MTRRGAHALDTGTNTPTGGTNIVAPRQTWLINRNWAGLNDIAGTPVVDELIRIARQGGGYHSYVWPKPSTGKDAQMISYVVGLQDWRWAVGTGVFVDDILASVAAARAETEERIENDRPKRLVQGHVADELVEVDLETTGER